jgi:D-sedoheptulose 7-phosphate isomerase
LASLTRNPTTALLESTRIKREFFLRDRGAITAQAVVLAAALKRGGKLISFGNGGSAAHAKRAADCLLRKGLPAVALPSLFAPDGPSFAALYQAVRRKGDCALAISTSGNSANVLETVAAAQEAGDPVIAFTGNNGGRLRGLIPSALVVGDDTTTYAVARIQEVHLMLVHELCAMTFSLLNA